MAMGCVGYNASFLNIYETEENKAPVRSYSLNSKEVFHVRYF
ncbi:hypothetical protein HZS_3344 [Henneguya salminicola]|nr:hypothetical protein HZS_3344 [Henneguya salminicola]